MKLKQDLLKRDNRERARASDSKHRRRISLEEKHENFIAAVKKIRNASGQQGAATKVKMSGSEKNKSEQEHKQQNFW